MRVLLQRVSQASVVIDEKLRSEIKTGLLLLIGIEEEDKQDDVIWLSTKISNMRIFSDSEDKMNLSVKDIDGEILVVSQFTLFASTKKGNRPSFIKSAKPVTAIPLYNEFVKQLSLHLNKEIKTGEFGADMKVNLTNDGPVTIWLDSKNKE
jgi:D-tyrosyl-tRNA(Tyr) deacylase